MIEKYNGVYVSKSEDKENIYIEYEYRGYRYEVYINKSKASEPLKWQHKNAQSRIDKLIEIKDKTERENVETVLDSLDWFFETILS